MNIGLALPHYGDATLDSVVAVAKDAERLGFDSVWMSDHLVFDYAKYGGSPERVGCLEPLTTLSVLAVETDRLRLGTMVLNNELRPPALTAKMAQTIDAASGRRLELGVGAGWYPGDFEPFGIPFRPAGVRLRALAHAVDVLKEMTDVTIWVGAKGDRALRVAAKADGWNAAWFQDPQQYAERSARVPQRVRRSIGQYARGSAQEMVDHLHAFADLGVEHAVMCFGEYPFGLDDTDDLGRFAQDVIPYVA